MPQLNMVQAIGDALRVEMRRNDRVVVLGEDVGRVGGVFRVTQGLFDEFGEYLSKTGGEVGANRVTPVGPNRRNDRNPVEDAATLHTCQETMKLPAPSPAERPAGGLPGARFNTGPPAVGGQQVGMIRVRKATSARSRYSTEVAERSAISMMSRSDCWYEVPTVVKS